MTERKLTDRPQDAEYVEYWLRQAGMMLLSLPDHGPYLGLRARSLELRNARAEQSEERRLLRRAVTPHDVSMMDEVLGWLRLVPDDRRVLRRIVAARMLVSPTTERHLVSWRELGRRIGADHHAVMRWHAAGIDHIVGGLAALDMRGTAEVRRAA